jgi:hypothetical protein
MLPIELTPAAEALPPMEKSITDVYPMNAAYPWLNKQPY